MITPCEQPWNILDLLTVVKLSLYQELGLFGSRPHQRSRFCLFYTISSRQNALYYSLKFQEDHGIPLVITIVNIDTNLTSKFFEQ